MGITSSLFYSSNDVGKQTLHKRITPTQEQYEEQQKRWNELADHLIENLGAMSGCGVSTWLQGSYKFKTQIRPIGHVYEFDIDLGVYFQWKIEADGHDRYTPDKIREFTQTSLLGYGKDGVVEVLNPPKKRCMRIRFEEDFHIDVPVYHLEHEQDLRRLATGANRWEFSDPKSIYLWFRDQFDDATRAKVRRQIQYLKCWTSLCFEDDVRPSSILLTVLVCEAFQSLHSDDVASDDDAFSAIVEAIYNRLTSNATVANPVDTSEILTNRLPVGALKNFIISLDEVRTLSQRALGQTNLLGAADLWSQIFSHFFPMPNPDEMEGLSSGSGSALIQTLQPEIAVRAIPRKNKGREFTGNNEILNIPRDCEIYFKIINAHQFPADIHIEWTVRNEGNEAGYVNDLGHHAGNGLSVNRGSAYLGTHYMDCVVKRGGVVFGARRVPVNITGIAVPKRNLPRPSWNKFRSKKR